MEDVICEVDLETVRVSPFQPRRIFSEEELDGLAASIRSVGLIHPPVVRKIENAGKFLYFELIAGERRWRAAKIAGLKKMNVIVRYSSDDGAAKATLIENIQRVELDPLETARAFKRLIEVFRMTQEEVAEKVGKKRSTVANYLRLLTLPQQIQEEISSGAITMGHAKALLSVDQPTLQQDLHSLITAKQLTVREAEKESARLSTQARKKKTHSIRDIHLRELEERLQESLGTKVSVTPGKNGGTLTLNYYSLDDLDRLCHRLCDCKQSGS